MQYNCIFYSITVGQKWCRFTNVPQKFQGPPKKIWAQKNIKFWTTFSSTSTLDTAYLQSETSHGQSKMLVSIYSVSPTGDLLSVTLTQKRLRSVCLLWRNIRRLLRCNHQSCDISSFVSDLLPACMYLKLVFYVKSFTWCHLTFSYKEMLLSFAHL